MNNRRLVLIPFWIGLLYTIAFAALALAADQ